MIESRIDVNLIYREDVEMVFSQVVEWLDREEQPGYSRRGEYRLGLTNVAHGCSLKIKRFEKHLYEYDKDILTLMIRCSALSHPDENGRERLDTVLSFVRQLYTETDPQYVFGIHNWRIEIVGKEFLDYGLPSPVTDDGLATDRIDYPTWLMVFPPAMVETYGREWLMDLPADRVEKLDDGAIMTVATKDIPDCESDVEISKMINEAMEPIETAFDEREV